MADNLQVSAKISEEKSVNILTLSVVRRDGAITPFKSDKISGLKFQNQESKHSEPNEKRC